MFFLPFDYFEMHTNIKPNEVFQKLCSVVETRKRWGVFFENSNRPYFGTVGESQFKIFKRTRGRSGFLPVVLGEIYPTKNGSRIRVAMRLNWLMLCCMALLLGAVGYRVIVILGDWIVDALRIGFETTSAETILVLSILLIFIYLMMVVLFKIEAERAFRFLLDLFEVQDSAEIKFYRSLFGLSELQIFLMLPVLLVGVVVLRVLFLMYFD